jgi:hypothetical protein
MLLSIIMELLGAILEILWLPISSNGQRYKKQKKEEQYFMISSELLLLEKKILLLPE